jgi:hypothetical protein
MGLPECPIMPIGLGSDRILDVATIARAEDRALRRES